MPYSGGDAWIAETPRWAAMWALAFAVFAAFKLLTWLRRRRGAPVWRHAAYLFAWPGMDVDAFLDDRRVPKRPTTGELLFAAAKTAFGLALLGLLAPAAQPLGRTVVGWVGMAGIVFALHFGLFHLLSCLWRSVGVEAPPLMRWPIAATSLGDFWGRRWNIAFRDLSHQLLLRPLAPRLGGPAATFAVFLASGLIHDLVISVPAGGGGGGPTCYFALQGCALLVDRRRRNRGLSARLLCAACVLLPCPLLLHEPFVIPRDGSVPTCRDWRVTNMQLDTAIYLIGWGQLSVLVASALVPVQLRWRQTLAVLPTLVRQLFWVYGGYVVFTIVSLAALCLTCAAELAAGGRLARAVAAYGCLFWGVRLSLQAFLQAKPHLTSTGLRLGYHALTVLFGAFTLVFAWAALH